MGTLGPWAQSMPTSRALDSWHSGASVTVNSSMGDELTFPRPCSGGAEAHGLWRTDAEAVGMRRTSVGRKQLSKGQAGGSRRGVNISSSPWDPPQRWTDNLKAVSQVSGAYAAGTSSLRPSQKALRLTWHLQGSLVSSALGSPVFIHLCGWIGLEQANQ